MSHAAHHRRPSRHARHPHVGARRRVAVRVGLGLLLAATVTACIFEKSNYQGGGRQDKGATATTASASSTNTSPVDTSDAAVDGPAGD